MHCQCPDLLVLANPVRDRPPVSFPRFYWTSSGSVAHLLAVLEIPSSFPPQLPPPFPPLSEKGLGKT